MSLIEAMGEVEEFGDRTIVPDSYYPVKLSLGDLDTTPIKDDGGGGTPYVPLSGEITGGPFEGVTVTSRYYLTPGGPHSKGGYIMILNGACKAITGMGADESAFASYGFEAPAQEAGEETREYGKRLRGAIRDFFAELTPGERLDFMTMYLRLVKWDGKPVVAHVSIEEGEAQTPGAEAPLFNRWNGFFSNAHPEKGLEYVRKVCFPKQTEELAAA